MQAEARGDFCGREQCPELGKETLVPEHLAGTPTHGPAQQPPGAPTEEQGSIPIPSTGLLQVTERRQPLSSVSSLEVHFDLLDLTELTDMSDQELAEVFADSDEENAAGEAPGGERGAGSGPIPLPGRSTRLSPPSAPQGCSRCRGPGTCARPPGAARGSRAGRRSTSATRSCRRDPRTPSCPPSGRGSRRDGPCSGGRPPGPAGTGRFFPTPPEPARGRRTVSGDWPRGEAARSPAGGPGGPVPPQTRGGAGPVPARFSCSSAVFR
uniref:Dysbindin domain-containing protein 1 n=1 Tax=Amazona collaria TaxID=241587 RepID=A0A8B9FFW4_9PSIT